MPSGTPSNSRCSDWRNRPQVPAMIIRAITMLVAGSSHTHPCHRYSTPAAMTPNETSASAAMCKNALRMLRSCLLPAMNSAAVRLLITTPIPDTTMMVNPSVGAGVCKRCAASHSNEPIATSNRIALANAARMDARCHPYVCRASGCIRPAKAAPQASNRPATSERLWPASASSASDPARQP